MTSAQKSTLSASRASRGGKSNALVHNLNGQRLGRKGRDTRERIIAATQELLSGPLSEPISLSAVARKVALGMSSLYLYFTDLTELLLAVLEPAMATAEEAFLAQLRDRWPDATLGEHCLTFMTAYYGFWDRHSSILHLRNQLADRRDIRMMHERVRVAQPVISLFVEQMDHDPNVPRTPAFGMASVLYTGIERVVTIATDSELQIALQSGVTPPIENWLQSEAHRQTALQSGATPQVQNWLQSEARLLELGIRDYRAVAK